MSNQNVGTVYASVIKDVVEAARIDFEEGGVDEVVLTALADGWRKRLTDMGIASFPWEPKPTPVPAPAPMVQDTAGAPLPTMLPQPDLTLRYTQAQLSPPPNALPMPLSLPGSSHGMSNGHVHIKTEPDEPVVKQEPGLAPRYSPPPQAGFSGGNHAATSANDPAAQRAAQALQQQYGARAAASISAIQSGVPPSQVNPAPHPQQLRPMQPQQHQAMNPGQQYRATVASNAAAVTPRGTQQVPPPHDSPSMAHANGLPQSQVDGAGEDLDAGLMQHDADVNSAVLGRLEADRVIHAQIATRTRQMQGGGIMRPLKELKTTRRIASKSSQDGVAQMDGPDDDVKEEEEYDADAINSDLDDPEDENDEDDDEEEGANQTMLCLYDKVQRVKNKWKCTLKDGVLKVNGREYVFHKATGEYEW